MSKSGMRFTLNGREAAYDGPASKPLIEMLREDFGLRGVRLACARGVCGSCTVLVDGAPAASCSLFAYRVEGCEVLTIEGLSAPGAPHPIAEAFAEASAFQCGYCTAGMLMLTRALLAEDPDPSRETVISWISSNICRCTGYEMIIEAVLDAARRLRDGR
jgi:aerobic carbon-monoxide dehydrogenase small subunit